MRTKIAVGTRSVPATFAARPPTPMATIEFSPSYAIRAWCSRPFPRPLNLKSSSLSSAQMVHSLLRLVLAVRYRKNLVVAVMAAAALLGGLYYATATRRYSAKAALLVTQTGPTASTRRSPTRSRMRQNTMPTFENMIRSAKVLEGALEEPGARRPHRSGRRAPGTLDRRLQANAHRQGDPIHQHLGGELSLQGPAGGGERGAGGRPVVPRFHGPHAQGDGRRDQPDVDQGAGGAGREAQPQAGGVAGSPPPLRRHGLPLRRQDAAPDGAAGGVLQRRPDRRAEAAGGARGPAGHHSDGGPQRRGPRAVPDVGGRRGGPGNAAEQPRPGRPRRQHPGQPRAEPACRPRRAADRPAESRPQSSRGHRAGREGSA